MEKKKPKLLTHVRTNTVMCNMFSPIEIEPQIDVPRSDQEAVLSIFKEMHRYSLNEF